MFTTSKLSIRWPWATWLIVPGVLLAWTITAQEKKPLEKEKKPPDEKTASVWMKQKLMNTERILEGLTRNDMDQVNRHASAMKALNTVESFVRREPPSYRTQLHQFQFALDEIIDASQAGNLDGATLAFTQMTISCVNCHKLLRKP